MTRQNIESIYPLSPLQNALLLHRVTQGTEDTGFLQARFTLHGDLNVPVLKDAWQQIVKRHAALRMTVQATDQQQPLLVVWRTVETPWTIEDWRPVHESERASRLEAYCEQDRLAGLNLSKPPAMRVALLRVEDEEHCVIWSCHHLLLDGWSAAVVLRDVFSLYHGVIRGEQVRLPPVSTLGDYYVWLRKWRDGAQAESFWKNKLRGFVAPTPVGIPSHHGVTASPQRKLDEQSATLAASLGSKIEGLLRTHQLTPNAFFQGAWALLLSSLSQSTDIVFGNAVSGRSFDLTGSESMVGLFANVLPMRAQIHANVLAVDWLRTLRDEQFQTQSHESASLADIEAWSEVPGSQPLFESLVLMQNIPWEDLTGDAMGGLAVRDYLTGITTNYALTVVVTPGEAWSIRFIYETHRFNGPFVASLLATFEMLLAEMVGAQQQPLSHMLQWLESAPTLADFREASLAPDSHVALSEISSRASRSRHVPARNRCELELTKIWEETLGLHSLGVQDDFFTLGGRSLSAVRMIARVEDQFGKQMPVASLWENPTIEKLALILQEDRSADWTSLVPIQPRGSKPPLFFIHAGGVHALFYGDVARRLGPDQPVYALQPWGLDANQVPFRSLEEIAAHYIDEIRSLQPSGPYFFAGHCFGAHAGFDMAQQLCAQGEQVALFAVLDAWPPAFKSPTVKDELNDRAARVVARLQQREWRQLMSSAKAGLLDYGRRLWKQVSHSWDRLQRPWVRWWVRSYGSTESRRMLDMQEVDEACLKAASLYSPKPYPGPITVIHTTDTAEVFLQWRELAADFVSHELPGGHRTIFEEPYVGRLGELLTHCLESASLDSAREERWARAEPVK